MELNIAIKSLQWVHSGVANTQGEVQGQLEAPKYTLFPKIQLLWQKAFETTTTRVLFF